MGWNVSDLFLATQMQPRGAWGIRRCVRRDSETYPSHARRRPVIELPLSPVASGQITLGRIDGWRKDAAQSLTLACPTADTNGPLGDTSMSGSVKQLGPRGCWGDGYW